MITLRITEYTSCARLLKGLSFTATIFISCHGRSDLKAIPLLQGKLCLDHNATLIMKNGMSVSKRHILCSIGYQFTCLQNNFSGFEYV
ncbi:hypothetical protein D3C76_1545610 [compost metagenome]